MKKRERKGGIASERNGFSEYSVIFAPIEGIGTKGLYRGTQYTDSAKIRRRPHVSHTAIPHCAREEYEPARVRARRPYVWKKGVISSP